MTKEIGSSLAEDFEYAIKEFLDFTDDEVGFDHPEDYPSFYRIGNSENSNRIPQK